MEMDTETAEMAHTLEPLVSDEDSHNISGENISAELSGAEIEHLAQLSEDLEFHEHPETENDAMMEVEGSIDGASEDVEQEGIIQPETVEVEIEADESQALSQPLKPMAAVPPLRPLSIAPKPPKFQLPFTPKPGQYIVVQSTGPGGQGMKLVTTSQSQNINLGNLTLAKPMALKAIGKPQMGSSTSLLQSKQLFVRKVGVQGKGESKPQSNIIRLEGNTLNQLKGQVAVGSPTKTLTLSRLQPISINNKQQAIVLNKIGPVGGKAVKVQPMPTQQLGAKKILPAPQVLAGAKMGTQRVLVKPAQGGVLPTGQIIEVSGAQAQQIAAATQLHPINGVQYIKIVTSSSAATTASSISSTQPNSTETTPQTINALNKIPMLTPVSSPAITKAVLAESVGAVSSLTAKATLKPLFRTAPGMPLTNSAGQIVVFAPPGYVPQLANAKVAIPQAKPALPKPPPRPLTPPSTSPETPPMETNGMRPRKPCNCTKSQCLKLYCDCFACGEFCHMCNCVNCYNNLEFEEFRQKAIRSCLERNPTAFRPKIGKVKGLCDEDPTARKHTKGCNCKRSGCLKNYCECYEAKISCSIKCKCYGCRNIIEEGDSVSEKKSVTTHRTKPVVVSDTLVHKLNAPRLLLRPKRPLNSKHAFSLITDDVIEATSQCLLAISDSGQANGQSQEMTKKQIVEEFGLCLMEIIRCSANRAAN